MIPPRSEVVRKLKELALINLPYDKFFVNGLQANAQGPLHLPLCKVWLAAEGAEREEVGLSFKEIISDPEAILCADCFIDSLGRSGSFSPFKPMPLNVILALSEESNLFKEEAGLLKKDPVSFEDKVKRLDGLIAISALNQQMFEDDIYRQFHLPNRHHAKEMLERLTKELLEDHQAQVIDFIEAAQVRTTQWVHELNRKWVIIDRYSQLEDFEDETDFYQEPREGQKWLAKNLLASYARADYDYWVMPPGTLSLTNFAGGFNTYESVAFDEEPSNLEVETFALLHRTLMRSSDGGDADRYLLEEAKQTLQALERQNG